MTYGTALPPFRGGQASDFRRKSESRPEPACAGPDLKIRKPGQTQALRRVSGLFSILGTVVLHAGTGVPPNERVNRFMPLFWPSCKNLCSILTKCVTKPESWHSLHTHSERRPPPDQLARNLPSQGRNFGRDWPDNRRPPPGMAGLSRSFRNLTINYFKARACCAFFFGIPSIFAQFRRLNRLSIGSPAISSTSPRAQRALVSP